MTPAQLARTNDAGHRSTPCRLIVDPAASGPWHMAVDEVLLASAGERRQASLRFYGWGEPTLSLGYFQSFGDAEKHPASRGCPRVRRQTGGGAILHDDELTYSLALPRAHPLAADAARFYDAVHLALAGALARFGIATTLRAAVGDDAGPGGRPFLCFRRRARGDVLLRGSKVCGSAQRRRRAAVLQHGSLLLGQSSSAPELPGIRELTGQHLDRERLIESWQAEIADRLGLALETRPLDTAELDAARTLALEKYGTNRWNRRR